MTLKKQSIWPIVFEFLSIVFAVLLALGLNSYKQNVDLEKDSEYLKSQIIVECKSNLKKVGSILDENSVYKSYLDSLIMEENVSGFSFTFNNEFLSSSMWSSSQGSAAFHNIDPVFLNNAAELYELQNFYMKTSNELLNTIGDLLIRVDNTNSKKMVNVMHYYLTNILSTASELQTTYQDFLKEHSSNTNAE